jgi:hypothetical protein
MFAVKSLAKASASSPLPGLAGLPCLEVPYQYEMNNGEKVWLIVPNEETVQVEESPLLGLPPVMLLALVLVALHGTGGTSLGDGVQENSAPSDVDIALSQRGGKFQLRVRSVKVSS